MWDRLFGSFREEDEQCVYGTRAGLRSWDPLWANVEVYAQLAQDSWRTRNRLDKLRVWFKPPGWRPADVAARWPKPAFDITQVQVYDPPVPPRVIAFVGTGFVLLLGGVAALLASLAGDVLLMLPGNLFIPGQAAFLMAAQAIGRAAVLQDKAATLVAVGACVFMLSDTLIAINRFLMPVPLASLWILATYYLAQLLIVLHAARCGAVTGGALQQRSTVPASTGSIA